MSKAKGDERINIRPEVSIYCVNADNGKSWKHVALLRATGNDSAAVSEEEAEEKARLVAAAPELLAACEEAADALTSFMQSYGETRHDQNVIDMLKAAIAKARGTLSDDDLCDLSADPLPSADEPEPPNNRVPGGGWRTV